MIRVKATPYHPVPRNTIGTATALQPDLYRTAQPLICRAGDISPGQKGAGNEDEPEQDMQNVVARSQFEHARDDL